MIFYKKVWQLHVTGLDYKPGLSITPRLQCYKSKGSTSQIHMILWEHLTNSHDFVGAPHKLTCM
jgi:hypothetical protein